MSRFSLSARSMKELEGVHPDLIAVTKRAIELTKIDFVVTEGVRTYSRQVELVEAQKSTTLHSKHLLQESGYGHAIDVAAWMSGDISWKNKNYGPIVQAFITAATEQGVQLVFGHLWKGFQDSVHVELNGDYCA